MATTQQIQFLGAIQPDWNQSDLTASDFINNKPDIEGIITDQLSTLVGDDTNKSMREIAAEEVAKTIDAAPETLDTLNELAAALGDDPNFATTVATEIGKKVDKIDLNNYIEQTDAQISSINGDLSNKIDKTSVADQVYATDESGNQITYKVSNSAFNAAGAVVRRVGNYISSIEPVNPDHLANKNYVDSKDKLKQDKLVANIDTINTSIVLNAVKTNAYVFGTLTDLNITFSTENVIQNDTITVEFVSGETATTLTRDLVNAIYNFDTINANKFVEINAKYSQSINKWIVYANETDVTL